MATETPNSAASWLSALRCGLVLIVLCGGLYPLVTTTVVGTLFSHQATGSLIERGGVVVGSALVGQRFVSDHYFHGRPSASDHDPFDVGGSNLAPSNPELRERLEQDAHRIAALEGIALTEIPVDLLAASGSGIDPHISPAAAAVQIDRVARARNVDRSVVEAAVEAHTEGAWLGVFGQPRVNVLKLNLSLDEQAPLARPMAGEQTAGLNRDYPGSAAAPGQI